MNAKLIKKADLHGSGPVRYRVEGPPEAPTSTIISIDYTDAPVPEHYYVADYFHVVNLDPELLFVFGKLDYPDKDKLRNKLEIYFPALFFVNQLWQSSRDFHVRLRSYVEENGYAPLASREALPSDKAQTIHSNNVLMVLSGGECLMDFFYLSPRDVTLKVRKKRNLELEPLVRIIVPPTLLLGFHDACEPIAQLLRSKFSEGEEKHENLEPHTI